MGYYILVLVAAIIFVGGGYILGRDAGIKHTMAAFDEVIGRIVRDVNAGRSLDWLERENRKDYK